ncbi:sensor histidine kinase [Salmonirosea aquatica]|uniref:histidine kinase n=1 Tax=Salmonirosea aquatica TaxID=2654236 RepID=A0A7C9FZN8_9BACT|nr:sensor histidine kinase [Cytophagaceae bacterium SJW1-29]
MEQSYQQQLLQAQIEVQEQTLKHISQELHDNIGQILSLVKINLNSVDIREEEAALQKLGNTKTLVTKALSDLRSLAKTLDANYVLRSKLSEALRFELDYIEQASGCATALVVQGEERLLTSQQQVVVFRIAQEVLNNAVKHAIPKNIQVELGFEPTHFKLRIADDGIGFDLDEMQRAGAYERGAGLTNMYTRSALIGAWFCLQSTPGQGTIALLEM